MNRDRLKPFYLVAVAINGVALAYAIDAGEYLLAGTFALLLVYIAYRFRSLQTE